MQTKKTTNLVLLGLFAAITFILAFNPIGFIQLGVIKATIIHIPVIVGSVLLGPKKGAVLGCLFGLASLISNTLTPALLSFAFSPFIPVFGTDKGSIMALFICFLPRIMVGIVPYYVYRLLDQLFHNKWRLLTFTVAGILGSFTNTLLVMNGIYFVFKDSYAAARSISLEAVYSAVLAIIFGNGIPEAIVAGIVTSALCKALMSNKQIRDMIS